eukprot:765017-Hanusia_phi.AAC.1
MQRLEIRFFACSYSSSHDRSGKQALNERVQFLSKVSILKELDHYEKFKIAEAMQAFFDWHKWRVPCIQTSAGGRDTVLDQVDKVILKT